METQALQNTETSAQALYLVYNLHINMWECKCVHHHTEVHLMDIKAHQAIHDSPASVTPAKTHPQQNPIFCATWISLSLAIMQFKKLHTCNNSVGTYQITFY